MLASHPNHVCTFFAADLGLHLGLKFADAAEKIFAERKPQHVVADIPSQYIFRWPEDQELLVLGPQRVFWQTLGFLPWRDRVSEHVALTKIALRAVGVEEFERIGFKVQAYLPLEMLHAELNQLMFGSFLAPAEELQEVCGEPSDPLVQIQGKKDDLEYTLILSGMNQEQISKGFLQTNNLEHFRSNKFLDTTVKDFHEKLTRSDSLYFDIDLFQRNARADTLETFVKKSLSVAEELANACVQRLRSQPIQEMR